MQVHQEASRGGRPAQLLALVGSAGRAIGVKVANDHIVFVEARLDGSLIETWDQRFDAAAADAVDQLVATVKTVVTERTEGEGRLLGVGIAVPGSVDDQAGGVVDAPTMGWQRLWLGRALRQAVEVPVLLENDVSAVAVAERLYGRGQEFNDFVVVSVGRGVGAGLIADGTLFRGSAGGAGEIGHLPMSADGPTCECGNTGCLEAYVGELGLLRAARRSKAVGPRGTFQDLQRRADAGETGAVAVFAEAGEVLGRAIAGLVNFVDPQIVVVLGEGTSSWQHWRVGFDATFRAHLLPARRSVPVEVESWDDSSWALGAAALVLAAPYDAHGTAGRQGALVRARLSGQDAPV